jgi:4-nitrophenyl phosphatase
MHWAQGLRRPEGFMFDLDGTLILSNRALGQYQVLPGAVELLTTLKERGIPFVVLTNGSAYPPAEQAPRLRSLGLPIGDDDLLTPTSVAADLMPRRGVKSALVLGTPGVGQALRDVGIETLNPGDPGAEQADAVYAGWHPDCSMDDIQAACAAILNGAEFYVASDVAFFATSTGKAFGYSCAIAGAIRHVTGARAILTGKPSQHALRLVSRRLGVPMRRIAVVGDDPYVEILMARRGGAIGLGVTSGVTKQAEWASQVPSRRPHGVLTTVGDILTSGLLS